MGCSTITVRTVCGLPDYLRCPLSVDVSDGIVTRVRPDKSRGWGTICQKALSTVGLAQHPDRLRHPMKRSGKRGEDRWERVTWDEALGEIAEKLRKIASEYGSQSIAWLTLKFPDLTPLCGAGYLRLISLMGGTWVDWYGCGDAAGPCADLATFGLMNGARHLARVANPRFMIIWGYNPAATLPPVMRAIEAARGSGCQVVVIDPRFTETARRADKWVPIRPGTDGALALGMINLILEEGLQDEQFLARNTVGPLLVRSDNGAFLRESDLVDGGSYAVFPILDKNTCRLERHDKACVTGMLTGVHSVSEIECRPAYELLADLVSEYTPQKVSDITEIPVDIIRQLAVNYATHKPAGIHRGMGMQRTFYGDLGCRAINTLAATTGNLNLEVAAEIDLNSPAFFTPKGQPGRIPLLSLHDAIAKGDPFPIKAMWCAGHNFVNQMPNMRRVINELLPALRLLVVCDLFMTATARYADYVLPATSFYESTDVCVRGLDLDLQQKAVEPPGEAMSDFRIAAQLGQRLGWSEYFSKTEEQCIQEILASHPLTHDISLERLRSGAVRLKAPDLVPSFRTPTGRIEFYVESLRQFGQALPVYFEPLESVRKAHADRYPLSLLSAHPVGHVHSTLAKTLGRGNIHHGPAVEIHPDDAKARSISDGDAVRVFNDRGELEIKARVSETIRRGVVNIEEGWWPEQYIKGHLNQLTHDQVNSAQQHIFQANVAFSDVLVEVEKVRY